METVGKRAVVLEVQSMLRGLGVSGGWKVAKKIYELAEQPPETFRKVGANVSGSKRSMSQSEAARIVAEARRRIALADAPD